MAHTFQSSQLAQVQRPTYPKCEKLGHLAKNNILISSGQKIILSRNFMMTKTEANASLLIILGEIFIYNISCMS